MSLISLSIRELVSRIRAGQLDPLDLAEQHLAEIRKHNPKLNALVSLNESQVLSEAKSLSQAQKKGELTGRLPGIPFSAKHNIEVAGFSISDGSKHGFRDAVTEDSPLVSLLKAEGAYCIGKGNMAEYGKSSVASESTLYGKSVNPYDLSRSPGGSTGGDAAALAAGFCDFSIGGDSGGSLRGPANFCGLFSILPTRGVILERGSKFVNSTFNRLFGSSGPIAKSLDDLELIFECMHKFDPLSPRSVELPFNFEEHRPSPKKFAFFSESCGIKASKEIRAELSRCVKAFESMGFEAEEVTPAPINNSLESFIVLAGSAGLRQEDLILELHNAPRDLSAESAAMKTLRQRLSAELPPLSSDLLLKALAQVDGLREEMVKVFSQYAFLLLPVAAGAAPKLANSSIEVDGVEVESYLAFHFSRALNLLGAAALSFPTGMSATGLPLGLQIAGPRFSDRWLFKTLRASRAASNYTPPKIK